MTARGAHAMPSAPVVPALLSPRTWLPASTRGVRAPKKPAVSGSARDREAALEALRTWEPRMGVREASRVTGIHHVTLLVWCRAAGIATGHGVRVSDLCRVIEEASRVESLSAAAERHGLSRRALREWLLDAEVIPKGRGKGARHRIASAVVDRVVTERASGANSVATRR